MGGRIVVGVADSPAGLAALRFAVAHARRCDRPIVAVRAWAAPSWPDAPIERWRVQAALDAQQTLDEAFTAAVGTRPGDVTVRVVVAEGFPGPVLVALADRDDDMLVVGGRRTRPWGQVTGPVSRHCLRRAGCPVVVVPPTATFGMAPWRLNRRLRRDLRRLP